MTQKHQDKDDARPPADEERPEGEGEAVTDAEPAAAPESADAAFEDALRERLAELEAKAAELEEARLRALAELENTRRQSAREVENAGKYAITRFARDLLEVSDNLARALASAPEEALADNEPLKALVEGVAMTERSLQGVLERHQIRRVEPQPGERFDHNLHQAMYEQETEAHPPGSIASVMQSGYVIADRLLRPALVGVAKAPAKPAGDGGAGDEAGDEAGGEAAGEARPGRRIDTTA